MAAGKRVLITGVSGQIGGVVREELVGEHDVSGIDIRKVIDTGIEPVINTGIAHREAGIGQIGAGITHAPMACFSQAVSALAETFGD